LKNGGRLAFEALLHLYRTAEFQEEKVRALGVLGSVPDEKLFVKVLGMTLTDEVRKQDIIYIYRNLGGGKNHLQLAWEFVQANWSKLAESFGETTMLGDIVKCFSDFASADKAVEVATFLNKNAPPKLKRTIEQTIESIRTNAAWLERDREAVKQWLDANL
jgi:puromycin-sensitive aminopeptidase